MRTWLLIWMMGISLSMTHAQAVPAEGFKACSAIRELIFAASQPRFGPLLGAPVRSSHGHQVMGSWKFETERYEVLFNWPGADRCMIEHSLQTTDSTRIDNWQYIAEFTPIADPLNATRSLRDILSQMEGCRWPLNDSLLIDLRPVNPEELPPSMPEGLHDAYLLALPAGPDARKEISVMVGLERVRAGYRPVLMVEAQEQDRP